MRSWKVLLVVVLGGALIVVVSGASASGRGPLDLTNIANANPKAAGMTQPNILSPELQEVIWAQGSYKLDGGTAQVPYYGYDGNGPFIPTSFTGTSGLTATEAQKTEPDKNTYLVLHGLHGADGNYDYGTHFLFQGHEATAAGHRPAATSRGSTWTPTALTASRCSRPRRRRTYRCIISTVRRGIRGPRS